MGCIIEMKQFLNNASIFSVFFLIYCLWKNCFVPKTLKVATETVLKECFLFNTPKAENIKVITKGDAIFDFFVCYQHSFNRSNNNRFDCFSSTLISCQLTYNVTNFELQFVANDLN